MLVKYIVSLYDDTDDDDDCDNDDDDDRGDDDDETDNDDYDKYSSTIYYIYVNLDKYSISIIYMINSSQVNSNYNN